MQKYKNQQKFASWIFTIAHNTIIDTSRKRKNNLSDTEVGDLNSNFNLENSLESKETAEIIYKLLNQVSEKQKQVFLLRQHSGLSFKEISEMTNQSLNTVISHMHYAVKKIRKNLKDNYEITR